MFKRTQSALLFWGVVNPAVAATPSPPPEGGKSSESQRHRDCNTASDAQTRKRQVERNLLPRAVFVGETEPGR